MKKMTLPLFLVSLILLGVKKAYANVPIGAAAFLAYPTVSYLTSSAVALIIAVALESIIFWHITKMKPFKVFFTVLIANLVSSLFGIIIFILFSSSFVFFILLLPIAYTLSRVFKFICKEANYFHRTAKFSFIIFIIFIFVCLVFGTLLLPATDIHMHKIRGALSFNMIAIYSIVMIILGFAITNLIEAFVIIKMTADYREDIGRLIVKAVLIMNLFSYVVLSAMYGKSIFEFVLKAI